MVCPKRGETSVILIDAAKVPTAGFKRLGRRFLHCRGTEQGKIGDLNSLNFDKPVIQHTDIIRYLRIDEWNTPFGILSIYWEYCIYTIFKCQENANESKNDWNFDHKDGNITTKNGVNGFEKGSREICCFFPVFKRSHAKFMIGVWKSETGLKWGLTWTCDSIGYHRTGFIEIVDSASRAHTWVMIVPLIAIIVIVDNPMWYKSTAVFSRMMSL